MCVCLRAEVRCQCIRNKAQSVWVPAWGGEVTHRNMPAVSSKRETRLQGRPIFVRASVLCFAPFLRWVHIYGWCYGGKAGAHAGCEKGCGRCIGNRDRMIKCIIDPLHEILAWIIEEITSQPVSGGSLVSGRQTGEQCLCLKWDLFLLRVHISARANSLRRQRLLPHFYFFHSSPPKPSPQLPVAHLHAAIGGCSEGDSDSGGGVKNGSC